MYPYIHIVIPSYAAMAVVGGFVTLFFLYFRIEKSQIVFSDFLRSCLFGVIGIILGSKILFVLTKIPWLVNNFSVKNLLLIFPQSGFVFYGGLFGFIFSLWIYTGNNHEYRNRLFVLMTPGIPLFHAFGRVGCFLTGCCYGKALNSNLDLGILEIKNIPVQLMEAFLEMIIFIVIIVVEKRKEGVNLLALYLVMYAGIRFCLEFMRGDEARGIFGGISTSQWISILIVLFYGIRFFKGSKKTHVKEVI